MRTTLKYYDWSQQKEKQCFNVIGGKSTTVMTCYITVIMETLKNTLYIHKIVTLARNHGGYQ